MGRGPVRANASRWERGDLRRERLGLHSCTTGLDDASVDAACITLVFHECPDKIKDEILGEAFRILRPGGTVVLSDTPNDDLHGFRGFYEPYKEQWLVFDPDACLARAGFEAIEAHDVAPPLWSRVARKPR